MRMEYHAVLRLRHLFKIEDTNSDWLKQFFDVVFLTTKTISIGGLCSLPTLALERCFFYYITPATFPGIFIFF